MLSFQLRIQKTYPERREYGIKETEKYEETENYERRHNKKTKYEKS